MDPPPFDPESTPVLEELLDEALGQADGLVALGAAQAEAWGSDVIALAIEALGELEPLVRAMRERADADPGAGAALAAVLAVAPPGLGGAAAPDDEALAAAPFLAALGTSRCEGGWLLRSGSARSVALRFVDAADERHVVTVDLVPGGPGEPEQVGEVVVGAGDLLDAIDEEDAGIELVDEPGGPTVLAQRVADAVAATTRPRESAVVNGHLLVRRLASVLGSAPSAPVAVAEEVPELPPRDPDDDAYARDVLRGALGPAHAPADRTDPRVEALADLVAPVALDDLSPAERDAVLILEWADWLGAVLGLVRAGVGTAVDGQVAVDLVNRCPEVTSTIPKADRDRIAWAFDVVFGVGTELGLLEDGVLTDDGVTLLPAALDLAWGRSAPA